MTLKTLLKDVEIPGGMLFDDIEISSVEYDSRNVKEGSVFVAIEGYATDGHKYIDMAVKNGACAVVCQKDVEVTGAIRILVPDTRKALASLSAAYCSYPADKMKMIGITGTNGKTTITYLVKAILEFKGHKVGLIGTNQNMIGSKVLESSRTTPESLELHKLLKEMYENGTEYVVMEVSSHSLYLDRVYGINFEIGAFTNLTQDHLDFHKTMDEYAKAKAKLFSMAKKGIINADDSFFDIISKNATASVAKYSAKNKSDIYAKNIKYSSKGVTFEAITPIARENIRLNIPGEFSVYNALCAIGITLSLGVSISDIAKALTLEKGVKGRAEVVNIPADFTVMIDYAHTPDGVENILSTVKGFAKGRIITLFGCGGDRDKTKRPIMGRIAAEKSDVCIVTSDNPRSEDPMSIINDIIVGIKEITDDFVVIENRKEAIEYAIKEAKKDDIILLCGKGHETYQILNTGTIEFDERKVVKEAFESISNSL